MRQEIHYLETGSQNPFYNLAFEEEVLRNRREGEYLLLWQNDNTIVIGQNPSARSTGRLWRPTTSMWSAAPPAAARCTTTWAT